MSRAARNSLKLSFFTIISRVLGLVRDHYQAVFFGTGAVATAWEIAYMLPNMLRNLLAEGVLSQSFIPIYSDALKHSSEEANRAAGVLLTFLVFGLILVVALGVFLFPYVLPLYTGKSREEASFMIQLSQVMFVFIMTASITAILSGISNTHNHFSVPALSPILLNIVFIAGFLVLRYYQFDSFTNAKYLAWVVVTGGFLQMILQLGYIYLKGWHPSYALDLQHPVLRKVFSLMAPAILGASLFQLNQLVDIAIASYMIPEKVGAVPALRYAHRLIQLPTGVIGVALSTAILPALTLSLRENRPERNGPELVSALSFALFLTVPAGIGLYLLGPRIIDLIFYGGNWGPQSTLVTWGALQFYTIGVPFYSINKVLTSSFYAYQDTRTPVRVMIRIVILNFVLNLSLVPFLYQGGLALSTSISALVNSIYLMYLLKEKMQSVPFKDLFYSVLRLFPSYLVLTLFLLFLNYGAAEPLQEAGRYLSELFHSKETPRYVAMIFVLAGVPGGGALYLFTAHFMKIKELDLILVALRLKKRSV